MQFNVWNPYVAEVADRIHVTFDVTMRDTAIIMNGTAALVSACLEVCGLEAPVIASWTVRHVRQSYYSDYADDHDWRARWDFAWVFDVELAHPVDIRNSLHPFPCTTPATDGSATNYDESCINTGTALVIAGFKCAPSIQQTIEDIVKDWIKTYGFDRTFVAFHRYDGGFVHARVFIDAVQFPEQLDQIVALNGLLRDAVGSTEWRLTANAS